MSIEAKLKPMLGRVPPHRTNEPGTAPNPDDCDHKKSCEEPPDERPPRRNEPRPPPGYCGRFPDELDEWEPEALDDPKVLENNKYFTNINSYRCGLVACNDAITSCAPINAGLYSPLTRAQPVFSYSRWKDGRLEEKQTAPEDDPPYGLADCSLIRAIAYHIDLTQSGDEVFIAIPAWSNVAWAIARSVTSAVKRGVIVRVIGGGGGWAVFGNWVKAQLDEYLGPNAWLKVWASNYKSFSSPPYLSQISHNKFVLIRRPALNQHLVLITSANWAGFDISRNCDLLTVDNKTIWLAFRQYFNSLWFASKDEFVIPYETESVDLDSQGRGITAQFWPRLQMGLADEDGWLPAKNPFVRILRKYKKDKTTKIRLATATWRDDLQGRSVLAELKEHRAAGSDVRVIGNHHLDTGCHWFGGCTIHPGKGALVGSCETREEIWRWLDATTPPMDDKVPPGPPIPWAKCGIHAKFLLVSGFQEEKNEWHQAIYTGSMNVSYERNMPDAFVGVHNDPVIFAQYEGWWNWLCQNIALSRGGSVHHVCAGNKKGE